MKRTSFACILLVALSAWPRGVRAQSQVDERRPAAANATVEIENPAGSIRVTGWDRPEVQVTGTLGRRAEGLDFSGDRHRIRISVDTRGNPNGVRSDLDIKVPQGSRLKVESQAASITVAGVTGSVRAESVSGSISVGGGAKEVDAETVNGSVEILSPATRVRAESVNGSVTVKGTSGDLTAATVNGSLTVEGGSFEHCGLESVSGSIRFEGDLGAAASFEAESVSGSIELWLPTKVSAEFSVSTFSGAIENELGPPAKRASQWTSEKELEFSVGSGGATVSVKTLSGAVRLRKR